MQQAWTVHARNHPAHGQRKYNPVNGEPRKHGPRCGRDIQGQERGPLRAGDGGRGGVLVPLRRLHHRSQHARRRGSAPGGGRVGLVPAAEHATFEPLPCRVGRLGRLRRVVRSLPAVVARPRPHVGRLQPHGVLPRRGRRPRLHLGPRSAAAYRRLRLSGGAGRRRRLRVPRQGSAGRGDPRAHLCPARQPRGVLERARRHDGDGSSRGARRRGGPGHPGLAQDAGRRGRGPDVLHLLLHVLPRRLAGTRGRARPVLRLHDHSAGWDGYTGGRRGARGVRA